MFHKNNKINMVFAIVLGMGLIAETLAGPAEFTPLPELKPDQAKALLGKRLFYDKRLSGDDSVACVTCHTPDHGFSHPDALSPAYEGSKHFRNSPSLINTVHKDAWLHDRRVSGNIEEVIRIMISESPLMNMDALLMVERLKQDPKYLQLFTAAGLGEPTEAAVLSAIGEFLKTLTSLNAPIDTGKMSSDAKAGKALFSGKAGCSQCHGGALFTDGKAYNTGVPENHDVFLDPLRHQSLIAYTKIVGLEGVASLKRDPGVHAISQRSDKKDMGKFLTPSLRELKHSAPYMHNGVFATLAEVVAFYNQGGGDDRHKDPRLKPLNLNEDEQKQLVAFLLALSGEPLDGAAYVWTEPFPEDYPAISNWRNQKN